MTTICAVSDLHGYLPKKVPEADILVVAGDISPINFDRDITKTLDWFESEFLEWIYSTPHKYRLFIGGNHDFCIEDNLKYFKGFIDPEDLKFLHDCRVEVEGIRFYGLPWVPNLKHWAFNASVQTLQEKFGAIPRDTDVVISHSPPYGFGDRCIGEPDHAGTLEGAKMIDVVKPKHYICGHIHEAYGRYRYRDTEVWNVSTMDVVYDPSNAPVIIEL